MRVISMIDEMMTLLELELVGEDNKKTYYVDSLDHWTQGSVVQQRRSHSGHAEIDP